MTGKKTAVLLASESPRRQEVLKELGISFETYSPRVDETMVPGKNAIRVAIALAEAKARKCPKNEKLVISMDTIVVISGRKLGKPKNRKDAVAMLRSLSNRMHRVVTGVALRYKNRVISGAEVTRVYFRKMEEEEIEWYVDSGEPYDKAGAYAIQGLARIFVDRIEGCYFNVIGFPIGCFQRLVERFGLSIWDLM